jgi:hypothetical protein
MSNKVHHFPFVGCAGAAGAIFLLVLALVAWVVSGLLSIPLCETDIRQEVLSPDGRLKMVVFSRDCGATTGFNSHGSIIRVGEELPDDGGNVFITDKDEVMVSWREQDRVEITLKGSGSDFKLEKQFQGITLDFR